jgi:cytoskeleton protein RodZ
MDAPDTNDIRRGEEAKHAQAQQVGPLLRAARVERGLSIEDVARQLRLSIKQVVALEEDEYDKVAGGTFLRGFVRNYAKLLQLDAAPLLQLLEQSVPPPPAQIVPSPIENIPFPSNQGRTKRNVIIGVGAVLALLLLVYEIYRGNEATVEKQPSVGAGTKVETEQTIATPETPARNGLSPAEPGTGALSEKDPVAEGEASSPVQHPTLTPSPSLTRQVPSSGAGSESAGAVSPALPNSESADTAVAPAPPSYAGIGIHLVFGGESWAEVKDGRGKLLLSKINLPGSEQVLRGAPPYSLTIGNAAQVKLVYNNKPVDLGPYINPYGGTARLSLE